LSVGVRGAHVTFGHGRITRTVGIPGTGIFYTHSDGTHSGVHATGHGWLWIAIAVLALIALTSALH
jgi:hypothetical protein